MPEPDDETKQLMDEIFIDKILRARRRSISEKILDGPKLFESSCAMMRNGIRSQHPDFNADQIEQELRRRLAIKRRIDEAGIYTNVGVLDE